MVSKKQIYEKLDSECFTALDKIAVATHFMTLEIIEMNEKLDKLLPEKKADLTEQLVSKFEEMGAKVVDVTPVKKELKKGGKK